MTEQLSPQMKKTITAAGNILEEHWDRARGTGNDIIIRAGLLDNLYKIAIEYEALTDEPQCNHPPIGGDWALYTCPDCGKLYRISVSYPPED